MPVILEETRVELTRSDLFNRRSLDRHPQPRTPGLHLSGVLRYLDPKASYGPGDPYEEDLPIRMALGLAWEEFAVSLYPFITWQPGEISVDGIRMTCDGHSVDQSWSPLQLEEFKYTSKKLRTSAQFLEDWHWINQAKGYCKGYGAGRVRWHVLYAAGDYKGSGPIYMRYVIQFSPEEIESTWRMITLNAKDAIEMGYVEGE